jgi:phosphohistidine phosphatase SixA
MTRMDRRSASRIIISAALSLPTGGKALADEAAWAALSGDGGILVFRHAIAPGGGDPPGMRIGDCATQRNLNEAGRRQAARIGETLRTRGVSVGRALSSQWCRALETARIAFPGEPREEPAFNSFFDARSREAAQTAAARAILAAWRGPGVLAAVTHQVNVTALTGVFPASGEAVALRFDVGAGKLRVKGRIRFD